MPPDPRFKNSTLVQRINSADEIGHVLSARWNDQTDGWMYQVQFGKGVKGVPEGSLRELVVATSPWDELRSGSASGAEHFRHALTFHRVKRPPSRIAKSFSSARTRFYPHQFKPLLKFLDNPEKRILVGDDVGLGKTIEAGYILCELAAQQVLENVLVLVPSRLRHKWKNELLNRFGETFEVVKGADVRRALSSRPGQLPSRLRWIASYESMRGLREELEAAPLTFDLVIIDEAHRARNSETQQHKVTRLLCDEAQAVVMLSATPVQNRLEDLWHLLRMLSPGGFPDFALFEEQMHDNAELLAAGSALTRETDGARGDDAAARLRRYLETPTGRSIASTRAAQVALAHLDRPSLSRRERVELQAMLGGLSPIAHIFSRTRKLEAIPNTAIRDASWLSIELTEVEREIHDEIETVCRQRGSRSGAWAEDRGLIMVYRALASCIPAAMAKFARDLMTVPDLEESEEEDEREPATVTEDLRQAIRRAIRHFERLDATDTKLAKLLSELGALWAEDDRQGRPRRKVVAFSYFRGTVEYLRQQLANRQIKCRMIHGGISPDDRLAPIDDFLEDPQVLVLLTTDVGGEGIDLQRASVLFNYDLPWNPMVVEQRIGRIDRIGQTAAVLVIRNMVLVDSVEERILKRLLGRIRIFEESIGEIDPIIGGVASVEQLTEQALLGQLSKEAEERAVHVDQNAEQRQRTQAEQLQERVDDLLAADQALLDEIEAVAGEHQLPSEAHLVQLINDALSSTSTGCVIPPAAADAVVQVDIRAALAASRYQTTSGDSDRAARFMQAARTAPQILITFSRDAAYRNHAAELIHSSHPLTRWAAHQLGTPRRSFRLALGASTLLRPGEYVFVLKLVDTGASLRGTRMVGGFAHLTDGDALVTEHENVSVVLGEMLSNSTDHLLRLEDVPTIDAAIDRLETTVEAAITAWARKEQELHELREERRTANIIATFELAERRAAARLEAHRAANHAGFAIRMAEAKFAKAQERHRQAAPQAVRTPWAGHESEDVAVGLLRVGG